MKKAKIIVGILIFFLPLIVTAIAEPIVPRVDFNIEPSQGPEDVVSTLQIISILTILAIAPSILIMMTSFTRIVVVFSFLRNAMGTQQMPPNQVLVSFALFLTFFIMAPVIKDINDNALTPYSNQEITQAEAFDRATVPIKDFMLRNTRDNDLGLFISLGQVEVTTREELPLTVVIPSFMISELKTAFQIGFMLYIPFLVVDMIVASVLMSMGMMMLPPVMISLPFKILLFVMIDGWSLLIQTLVATFQ